MVLHPRHILLTRHSTTRLDFAATLGRQTDSSSFSTEGKLLLR